VRHQLQHERQYLRFPESQRTATRGHLAAVIKMALVLKKLTLEGGMLAMVRKGDDEAQNEREEALALERSMRQMNDTEWTRFCGSTLKFLEVKWTKKLEDYLPSDH
jgi:hypothetical protein